MADNLPPLPEPFRPNKEGQTPCLVRHLIETPHGWIGSWDADAIPEFARFYIEAGRNAALIEAAELCEDEGRKGTLNFFYYDGWKQAARHLATALRERAK